MTDTPVMANSDAGFMAMPAYENNDGSYTALVMTV